MEHVGAAPVGQNGEISERVDAVGVGNAGDGWREAVGKRPGCGRRVDRRRRGYARCGQKEHERGNHAGPTPRHQAPFRHDALIVRFGGRL
ncbi:MAG: hypothetical protein M5U31_09785 [Acidimicrobiia bacterium]|nr:hypothetical protein [Acidimicrobiia bacterium]